MGDYSGLVVNDEWLAEAVAGSGDEAKAAFGTDRYTGFYLPQGEADRAHYGAIARIGLTDGELSRIVTGQLALLFFVPTVLALAHSLFAFVAQQQFFLRLAGP